MSDAGSKKGMAERTQSSTLVVPWWKESIRQSIQRFGAMEFALFLLTVVCFALTIVTTWPLWSYGPEPSIPLQGVGLSYPVGWLLLIGLMGAALFPRWGTIVFCGLLAASLAMDLTRCQPQVFAFPLLMAACIWKGMRPVCCWYLIAMWLWAGIHKLLSPYWMGPTSWSLLDDIGFENPLSWYLAFAWFVALSEIGLGLLAIFKPKFAAPFCVVLHLGIIGMLLAMNWNFSVLYWNLATAAGGFWLLFRWSDDWVVSRNDLPEESERANQGQPYKKSHRKFHKQKTVWPTISWQQVVACVFLIVPAGVYQGLTPHFLAHVLYSDNMPRAVITSSEGAVEVSTFATLHAPFPRVPSMLVRYFSLTGEVGDKLHILDYRPGLQDRFYMISDRGCIEPSRDNFLNPGVGVGRGAILDHPVAVFCLERAGARLLKRSEKSMIYAIQFKQETFEVGLLKHLHGLKNLEQIQLGECNVTDEDLRLLGDLPLLSGIGLDNTNVTDECLEYLNGYPNLVQIEHRGTSMTEAAVKSVTDSNR